MGSIYGKDVGHTETDAVGANDQNTKKPEVLSDAKESEVSSDTKKPEVSSDTKKPEVSSDTKESEVLSDTANMSAMSGSLAQLLNDFNKIYEHTPENVDAFQGRLNKIEKHFDNVIKYEDICRKNVKNEISVVQAKINESVVKYYDLNNKVF